MKKTNNKGFVLIETIIVSSFVAGILIFTFIEFTSLTSSYSESFKYNTVEDLYTTENIKNYILSDSNFLTTLNDSINPDKVMDITNCSMFTNDNYCKKLFELSNIENIIVCNNYFDEKNISVKDEDFKTFIDKIKGTGKEKYRIIVKFKDSTFSTIRFGE